MRPPYTFEDLLQPGYAKPTVVENPATSTPGLAFMLATVAENNQHAALMKKYPGMEHDDPNAKRLKPFTNGALLWKFTKAGTFEYACLIPGHREVGMHGTVTVK